MQEVCVTRCNMVPEMGKFYRVFEYMGRLICLPEASVHKNGFTTDISEICWITEAGERIEMTSAEKTKIVCEIKQWNKHAKREGKMVVRFVGTIQRKDFGLLWLKGNRAKKKF